MNTMLLKKEDVKTETLKTDTVTLSVTEKMAERDTPAIAIRGIKQEKGAYLVKFSLRGEEYTLRSRDRSMIWKRHQSKETEESYEKIREALASRPGVLASIEANVEGIEDFGSDGKATVALDELL